MIATGIQYSVRQFIELSAAELGVTLEFVGEELDEKAIVTMIKGDKAPEMSVGDVVVRIDPRYFRPTEVDSLLGDSTKAEQKLGWVPEITLQEICKEMITEDLVEAKRNALLKKLNIN